MTRMYLGHGRVAAFGIVAAFCVTFGSAPARAQGNTPIINRECADIWIYCSPEDAYVQRPNIPMVFRWVYQCDFQFQTCLGVEAYDRAFSLVHPQKSMERIRELREAAYRFTRTIEFALLELRRDTPFPRREIWYLMDVVGGYSYASWAEYWADTTIDQAQVAVDAESYLLSTILLMLERYLRVTEELLQVELARADAVFADSSAALSEGVATFAARKHAEYELRSRALRAVLGGRALVPPCFVDSEHPAVAYALDVVREKNGNVTSALEELNYNSSWLDVAVRYIQEETLATSLVPAKVNQQNVLLPTRPTAPPPWVYQVAISQEKLPSYMPHSVPESAFDAHQYFDDLGVYGDDGLAPDMSTVDSATVLLALFWGAPGSFGSIDSRGPESLPTMHARVNGEERRVLPAVPFLQALRSRMLSADGTTIPGPDPASPGVSGGSVDALTATLREALGDLRAAWTLRLFAGDFVIESFGLPQPIARYVVVGRRALEQMASGAATPAELATTPLTDGGSPVWDWQAVAVSNTGVLQGDDFVQDPATITVAQRFAQHPVRDPSAWDAVCYRPPEQIDYAPSECNFSRGASFADDLFLLRERIPVGGLTETGAPETRTQPVSLYLIHEYATCPPREDCFRLSNSNQALVVDGFSSAEVVYSTTPTRIEHRLGGTLDQQARQLLVRERDRCSEVRYNSLGLPRRLVPPLENELTDDLDPYESSFVGYLARAKDAALSASAIASEARALEAELEQDIAVAEQEAQNLLAEATQAVESICGTGAGDVGCFAAKRDATISAIGADGGTALLPPADVLVDLAALDEAVVASGIGDRDAYCAQLIEADLPDVPEANPGGGPGLVGVYATVLDEYRVLAQCMTYVAVESIREEVIPDLPEVLLDGELSLEEEAAFGGRYKIALIELESELLAFSSSVVSATGSMQALDLQFGSAKSHISSLLTSENARTGAVLDLAGSAIQSVVSGAAAGGAPGAVVAAMGAGLSTVGRYQQLKDTYRREEEGAHVFVGEFIGGVLDALADLKVGANTMEISRNRIATLIEELQIMELEQQHARARAKRMINIIERQVFDPYAWTTATRSNFRAHEAIRRSKVLSYIARMAIEFRLVVDLARETTGGAIVDPPSAWVDGLFLLDDRIAEHAAAAGALVGIDTLKDPIHLATVDYIEKLEDYVMFYSFEYPFQGNEDTAVLSMKDDVRTDEIRCGVNGVPLDSRGVQVPGDLCRCLDELGNEVTIVSPDFVTACFVEAEVNDAVYTLEIPYDHDGVLLRNAFRKRCIGDSVLHPAYDPACSDNEVEHYEISFTISLADIEAGQLASQGQIAPGRYNYRLDNVALNLVGSNVKDCSRSGVDLSACHANAFLPFSLEHTGEVELRDHGNQPHTYRMTNARVQSGKALAAERFLTSPLSDADAALIRQYSNVELRGRPLQGVYTLRLRNVPSLAFLELEDVQLVLTYRSWTAFDPLD